MGSQTTSIGKNRNNNSYRLNDESDERTIADNSNAVVRLKKPACMQILLIFRSFCRNDRPLRTRGDKCVVYAQFQHIFQVWCVTTSMLHIMGDGLDVLYLLLGLHASRISIDSISSSRAPLNPLRMKCRCLQ
ncbi:hypothetical protein TNCV_4243931 [Trichonephila clavipes]|nr:hypothetical protein TNCV_4243931 [Trichonephila clavipes]